MTEAAWDSGSKQIGPRNIGPILEEDRRNDSSNVNDMNSSSFFVILSFIG